MHYAQFRQSFRAKTILYSNMVVIYCLAVTQDIFAFEYACTTKYSGSSSVHHTYICASFHEYIDAYLRSVIAHENKILFS